uniref:AAA+ ATPase domain-containing protein n=1 Tax=Stomoxys calcitrans TaxID=35570 RepID=A0A1I8QEF3_STOCA
MSGSLYILPLESVDNFVSQKCLLPKDRFPQGGRPGQWAKCWFSPIDQPTMRNFAVCQIFPREQGEMTMCYMDMSICQCRSKSLDQRFVLDDIVLMDENEIQLRQIEVSFSLTPNDIKGLISLTKVNLKAMATILLQEYHFSAKCFARSHDLERRGIDGIYVESKELNDNLTFTISDDTEIRIQDITLSNRSGVRGFDFNAVGPFQRVRRELENMVSAVKLQRKTLWSQRMSLNALIVGVVGSGKTSLVDDFLQHHRCNVFRVTSLSVAKQYPGEAEAELRSIFKAAQHFEAQLKPKEPTVILIEDIHLLCPQSIAASSTPEASITSMRIVTQILSLIDELHNKKSGILCLGTTNSSDTLSELVLRPGRFDKEISIGALTSDARKEIIAELFEKYLPASNITQILMWMAEQTQGYVLADLALFVRNVTNIVLTRPNDNIEAVVKNSLHKSKPMAVRGTDVTVLKTKETFDIIGGMHQLKRVLEVSVLAGLKREEAFRKFGLSLPKGLLLYGPPGCAKTTVAKCLATEAKMTFIATSGAEVYSPYIGCAEKFVAKIFDTARRNSPCLIFLDEIDSLVGRRAMNASSGDVQLRIMSTILTEMDGILGSQGTNSLSSAQILVVAATNRPDMVDDALLRPGRFDKLIHVPAPDKISRRCILALHQQRMPIAKNIDLDEIAARTHNYSGADMCNLCNEVALNAFQRNFRANEITYEDFDYVLRTSSKSSLTQNQIDWYYQFENKFVR